LNTNRDASVGWITTEQTFPIGAGKLTETPVLQIERVPNGRDDFNLLDSLLER
jgi:hypothetical protein